MLSREPLQTSDGPEIDEASEVDVDGNETVAEDGSGFLGENGNGVVGENGNGCEYVEEKEKEVEKDDAAEYLNKDDGIENGNGIAFEDGEGGIAAEDEDEEGEGGAEDEDGEAAVNGDAEESSSDEDGIADEETDPDDDSALFDDDENLNNEVGFRETEMYNLHQQRVVQFVDTSFLAFALPYRIPIAWELTVLSVVNVSERCELQTC